MKVVALLALVSFTSALEGAEEACPAFAQGETPSCEDCVMAECGYAQDHGDCVSDCTTVTDTTCFSLAANSGMDVGDICAMAVVDGAADPNAAAGGNDALPAVTDAAPVDGAAAGGGGAPADGAAVDAAAAGVEEIMCAAFEGSSDSPTCESCVDSGCGWTSDDGDCLLDCAQVNDGAECISLGQGQSPSDVCGGGGNDNGAAAGEEVMCAALEGSSAPTCKTCVEAGCGWTSDDGDCLESCASVNDGADCIEIKGGQDAFDVCDSSSVNGDMTNINNDESGSSSSNFNNDNSGSNNGGNPNTYEGSASAASERMVTLASVIGLLMVAALM